MPSIPFWINTLLLTSSAAALPSKRQSDNTLHLDVIKQRAVSGQTVNADFTYDSLELFVKVQLGGKDLYSNLDTGSSNLVVFPKATLPSGNCPYDDAICNARTYDGTPNNLNIAYAPTYGDGDGGSGGFYTDTLNFEGINLENFQFADLTVSNTLTSSVFGTGYQANENTAKLYENLPLRLVSNNAIRAPVFSLWLNGLRSDNKGSMLYGGIDNAKFCNTLQPQAVIPDVTDSGAVYREFKINLAAATTTNSNGVVVALELGSGVALLDSGTNTLTVPVTAYNQLLTAYGATASTGNRQFPRVDCALANSNRVISFVFGGISITVPIKDFISQFPDSAANGGQCAFFVSSTTDTDTPIILGTPFLSAAYVVHDLGNNVIYLGQAVIDPTSSNIIAVNAGTTPFPLGTSGGPCQIITTTTTTGSMSSTSSVSSSTTTSSVTTTKTSSTSSGSSSTTTSSVTTTKTGSTSSGSSSTSSTQTTGSSTSTGSVTGSSTSTKSTSSGATTSVRSTSTSSVSGQGISTTYSTGSYTWANWSGSSSAKPTSKTTSAYNPNSWSNWNGNPSSGSPTSKKTSSITSAATWSAWNSATTQKLSYSTITTTIYVCPGSKKDCGAGDKTKTVTVTVVPYTTSTVYTTKTVTVTAGNGAWTTSTSVYAISTTVCPYTPAASTGVATWSNAGSSSASWSAVNSASPASWSGYGSNGPAATGVAAVSTWSGVAAASTWSGVSTPAAASTWAAASSGSGNAWVAAYTGGASSLGLNYAMTLAALIGSAVFMLL